MNYEDIRPLKVPLTLLNRAQKDKLSGRDIQKEIKNIGCTYLCTIKKNTYLSLTIAVSKKGKVYYSYPIKKQQYKK